MDEQAARERGRQRARGLAGTATAPIPRLRPNERGDLPLAVAAARLRRTPEALRAAARHGAFPAYREDGRWYAPRAAAPDPPPPATDDLVGPLTVHEAAGLLLTDPREIHRAIDAGEVYASARGPRGIEVWLPAAAITARAAPAPLLSRAQLAAWRHVDAYRLEELRAELRRALRNGDTPQTPTVSTRAAEGPAQEGTAEPTRWRRLRDLLSGSGE